MIPGMFFIYDTGYVFDLESQAVIYQDDFYPSRMS